jgi:hypothetical protein
MNHLQRKPQNWTDTLERPRNHHPSVNMVLYETDKLLVDSHSIMNTCKKPFKTVATECE